MFCGECGQQLNPAAAFCSHCGAPVAAPPPPARSRRGLVVLLTVAALVLVGGGVAAAVVLTRDDGGDSHDASHDSSRDSSGAPVAALDEGIDNGRSVLSKPGDEWTFFASDIAPGGYLTAMDDDYIGEETTLVAGPDVGAVMVTTLDDAADVLVGVDLADGGVLWQEEFDDGASCWPVGNRTALLCSTGGGEETPWRVLDVATGSEQGTVTLPGYVTATVWAAGTSYVATLDDDFTLHLDAVSDGDLQTRWSTELPLDADPDSYSEDGLDATQVRVTGDQVDVSYGPSDWSVTTGAGEIALTDVEGEAVLSDGYRVMLDANSAVLTTQVADAEGNTILNVPGTTWGYFEDNAQVQDGTVGVADTLWDLASGTARWSRADLVTNAEDEFSSWTWSTDHSVVIVPDSSDASTGATVLDGADGSEVGWVEGQADPDDFASTNDAFVIGDFYGTLSAASRATGETMWSRDVLDVVNTDEDSGFGLLQVAMAETSIVAAGEYGLMGFTDFSADPERASDDGGTTYATDCGSEPVFTPIESEAAYGGVTTTFTVTAVCPGGQWLSSSAQTITMTADTDAGTQVYASGIFDFSDQPLWVPDESEDPITLPLTFPIEGTYATPEEVNTGVESQLLHVDCTHDPDAYSGPVPLDPADSADPSTALTATSSAQDATASEESALAALQRLAAQDDPYLATTFEGFWVPQLSSKVQGTQDDGIVYTYEDILAEHLRLRLRYPDVRLAQSSDWKSFLVPGYWVTLVGLTSTYPASALTFCEDSGFTVDHCYAKRLLRDGPAEGSTKHRD